MSELEFNQQTEEVTGMVNRAHQGATRPCGVIVYEHQARHLLELEAQEKKLTSQIQKKRQQLAAEEERFRQMQMVHIRAQKMPKIIGGTLRLLPAVGCILGSSQNLMDPVFGFFLGAPCVLWAALFLLDGE